VALLGRRAERNDGIKVFDKPERHNRVGGSYPNMLQAIGDLLPTAVGISISPLPIIGLILLLMSPRSGAATLAFVAGWITAIAVALASFTFFSTLGFGQRAGPRPIVGAAKLLVGLVLLYLAYREWRARPRPGETGELPHWLSAVQNMGPLAAAGMGFAVYVANPKNLTLGIAAGVALGAEPLPVGPSVLVGIVYVAVAASTVVLPSIACLAAPEKIWPWLDELRQWLAQHNAALMAVLLVVIGTSMFGRGLSLLG
jgi:hypothetical protein